jgi:hypothetical protein
LRISMGRAPHAIPLFAWLGEGQWAKEKNEI